MTGQASRLAKLRAMPAQEIAARLEYRAYLSLERFQYQRSAFTRPDRLQRAIQPSIRQSPGWERALAARPGPARFFSSVDNVAGMRALFEDRFTAERDKARAVGDSVARGEIEFFGRQFSFGSSIDWHADPVTGAAWPRLFHADMPVHGGDAGYGDVKDVWEINRHQFFVDLAKLALLDRSRPHADALHRLLRHWMAEVPYGTGAAWACALEPAFRAWSWMWAYHMVRAAGMLDTETHLLWLTGFYDHGRFLHRHLEVYSSPYNHLIGEASALFALGMLFPEFTGAPEWAARGRHVLESTLGAQFHADGGTVEQSTFYHHATLGFYLLAAMVGRLNGADLSEKVWKGIERGLEFSGALVQPDGRVPRIGGADDGKPIRLEILPFWDFRPYQAIGAVLFSRPDFRFVAGRFWEDALWVLGPGAAAKFDALQPREPATATALRPSGYYVARSDWSPAADYLLFDCGEQAGGLRRDDVPSAAHGHADCLSIVVALGGREVLVDPGFFCYNGDPAWEVHFRKTTAHNTVMVDGQDQATHVSKMAWVRTYAARPEGWSAESLAWARGSHDGYARPAGAGVTHRRTAWLRPDGYVVIADELAGNGTHTGTAVFQFAPGELSANGSSALYDGRYEMAWTCSAPVTAQVSCGGDSPAAGWIAASLGVRQAAPRLALHFPIEGHVTLLTVLADRARHAAAGRIAMRTDAAGTLRADVWCGSAADEVALAREGAAAFEDARTDAPLAIVRRVDGRVSEVHHANRAPEPGSRSDSPARTGFRDPVRTTA